MAVYQGARRRAPLPLGLDAVAAARDGGRSRGEAATRGRRGAPASAERAAKGRTRTSTSRRAASAVARRRPSVVGIGLAAIVIVFSAAFLSLSQSVRVAATSYDIVRLASEHDRLAAIQADLRSDVARLRSEPAIRKMALDAGLGQLGAPLIVQAR